MGLFGGFGGFFRDIGRSFAKARPLKIAKRAGIATSTFGLSEVVRKVAPKYSPLVDRTVISIAGAVAAPYTGGLSTLAAGAALSQPFQRIPAPGVTHSLSSEGVQPMAINIGGILSGVGSIFGQGQNPYFQGVSNVASLASQFFPPRGVPSYPNVPAVRTAAALPMLRGGAIAARGFFNKFPNLALAIQQLRARGITVKRAQLWSMLKRFGPEAVIGGGLLTAGAVSELMMAGPGHRRMNPGNVKALRRSLRRVESFHKLCVRADSLRSPRRRGTKKCATSGSQFVRQG